MRVVAAIPALALIVGCAAGLLFPEYPPNVVFFLTIAASAVVAIGAWRRSRTDLLAVAVAASFCAGGAALARDGWRRASESTLRLAFDDLARKQRADAVAAGRSPPEDDSAVATLTGVLIVDGSPSLSGASLSVRVDEIEANGRRAVGGGVLLTIVGEIARERVTEWRAGRTVRMPVMLRRPSRYLDPGVPDEERTLERRGTALVGTVKSGALVEVIARGGRIEETAASLRSFARRTIARYVGIWNERAGAIVTAIVIGDRAGLDAGTERTLQEAGTYHVIAISGGNIAILVALTLGIFRFAGTIGRSAILGAMGGLVAYADLVGGGASVNRATLMAVVYLAGRVIDLRGPPSNTLALVAGLLVAADPLTVADPAFLLTFGATAAILGTSPAVTHWHLPRHFLPIASMLVASIAAEAALFPVGAIVFSRVTVAGLLLNFAAIPLMAVAQIAGMALLPVAVLSTPVAAAIGWVAFAGAAGLVRSAELIHVAPILAWRVAPPSWFVVAGYYASGLVVWTSWASRFRSSLRRNVCRVACTAAACCGTWIVAEPWAFISSRGDGHLHATFVDVGQGDAGLIRFPHGFSMTVDAGGLSAASSFDIGDRVVAPVIRQFGLRRLDVLALTHGDGDHIGGASALLTEFRPRDVWEGIPVPPFQPLQDLRASAAGAGSRWTTVQTADRSAVDDVQVIVRHPDPPDWERQKVRNDDSIVLEILWRDVSIVMTGDIGREVERAIQPQFSPSRLRVVKVPHHGSLTSSSEAFVRTLAARVAVVSVGRSNLFGHPAPVVLDRYRASGAEVFRTDQDGAVTVDTDGYSLDVHTFTGRRASLR